MLIPKEYASGVVLAGGGFKYNVAVLRDFVEVVKTTENEHDITLTSLENAELFEQFCEPVIHHFIDELD